jgi:hypothetical protein
MIEVFEKYYKYTTRTNNSGDYIICGVPTGNHTIHMDLDLSDCGILSQRPRDFVYKGYTIEQFENPNQFKVSDDLYSLSQIITQDKPINVIPFWGDSNDVESIGITRADINVSFKFEPTCVFIGSVVSDNSSNGITKKCRATENMGNMEEMVTGLGTIEMIRKTPTGAIESFAVRGNQLINGDGIWCYQIPMNLDYVMTDEYGNMVPTNDPEKGIPTRTSVRFRISMQDNEENLDFFYRSKVLVPHNPHVTDDDRNEDYDYEFGSYTRDESFRDLFWDNVYTVKSYIPRFQKKRTSGWKDRYFTGVKNCNFYGNNNPFPYNNIRIKLPFMFSVMCVLIKCLIAIVSIFNSVLYRVGRATAVMGNIKIGSWRPFKRMYEISEGVSLNVLSEGLCPDLENWYFAPISVKNIETYKNYDVLEQTMDKLNEGGGFYDEKSIDYTNKEDKDDVICITTKKDYLISCVEMNLAMEYRVINFDFYNDWVNGVIYVPRFMRYIKRKKRAGKNGKLGKIKVKGCMDDASVCSKTLRYAQQCSIGYNENQIEGYTIYTNTHYPLEKTNNTAVRRANNLHKNQGFQHFAIFGNLGGICHEHTTSKKQNVYLKVNDGEWVSIANQTSFTLNTGDKLYFKNEGEDLKPFSVGGSSASIGTTTKTFDVAGNVDEFMIPSGNMTGEQYSDLFNNTKVVDASKLLLPTTMLAEWCYSNMFNSCTSLTAAPVLPATTLADSCYYGMFNRCTSLTTAPELPATELAEWCYNIMFSGCTSLTTAPELPATTLKSDCYEGMFHGCLSLTKAPELPATTLAHSCYYYMFYNCRSLTTAPALPATTLEG